GETRSCYGCHATQTDAVPNASVMAVKYGPVKVTRESTDLQYRRNDPEAYRRQARLDEVEEYRKWLHGKDPVRRARACETLLHLEDLGKSIVAWAMPADGGPCEVFWEESTGPILARLAELLRDTDVGVRRAAALALTRLATGEQAPALKKALAD